MQIELSRIVSSPQAIRTAQDEAKIVELMESIGEYGLLQAIEVRPIGDKYDKYEVVFGNRRVEACRRLGHTLIRTEIRALNDSTALIHGLIENVVREDLTPLDKARALKVLQNQAGWSTRDIAAQGFMSKSRVDQLLKLLEEPEEVQQMLAQTPVSVQRLDTPGTITAKHVELVRKEKLPPEDHIAILQKAAKEGLTASQARVEARILKTYGTEEEQVARVERHAQQDAKDDEQRWWNAHAGEVAKDIVRTIKRTRDEYKHLWLGVERGAIGPEHMPYLEKRLRDLGEYLIGLADELDERRKGAVGG